MGFHKITEFESWKVWMHLVWQPTPHPLFLWEEFKYLLKRALYMTDEGRTRGFVLSPSSGRDKENIQT